MMYKTKDRFDETEIYPSNFSKYSSIQSSNYKISDLVDRVLFLSKLTGIKINRIYLTPDPTPNASCLKLPFSESILIINSNILDIMTKEEVDAVISHELGHIKNNDTAIKLASIAPFLYISITFLFIYISLIIPLLIDFINFKWSQFLSQFILLIFVVLLSQITVLVLKVVQAKSMQYSELAADIFSAKVTSPESIINSLVHLGQRIEVISILLTYWQEFKFRLHGELTQKDNIEIMGLLEKFPLNETNEAIAEHYAPFIFLFHELSLFKRIFYFPWTEKQIANFVTQSIKNLKERGLLYSSIGVNEKILSWKSIDKNQNHHLEKNEIDEFVKLLKINPDRFIFNNEITNFNYLNDHPMLRERIITVYELYERK